ncbi:uncharacterized protein LOC111058002 isoform X2 [Nilaparvata lugens]|nr:uncharacterized protein LOC111058002 isoform X2 [Nilaparvata lugens]XP_039280579.1 uncharacterized protein LOC111058002 isoform X2 [Nilaparvata lugens]
MMRTLLDVVHQEIDRKTLPTIIANDPTFLYLTTGYNITAFLNDKITYNKFQMYITAFMQDYKFLADNREYRQLVSFVSDYWSERKNKEFYGLSYPDGGFKRDYLAAYLETKRSKRHLSPALLEVLKTDVKVYDALNRVLANRITVLMMNKANIFEERFFFEHIFNSIDDLHFSASITKYYQWQSTFSNYIENMKSILDQLMVLLEPKLKCSE